MSCLRLLLSIMIRMGRLIRYRLGLRRPTPWRALRDANSATELIRYAWPASARNLALATAFLPLPLQQEAAIAYLCCRALDAYEDLSTSSAQAIQGMRWAARFICGASAEAPARPELSGGSDSDRLEGVLAANLRPLRQALEGLLPVQKRRVKRLILRLAAAMVAQLKKSAASTEPGQDEQRYRYGGWVLGESVAYAVQLVLPKLPLDRKSCQAVGRVLQAANDLRDLDRDAARVAKAAAEPIQLRLLPLLLGALIDLPVVRRFLERIQTHGNAELRACATIMIVTTTRFYERYFLGAALAAGGSPLCSAIASLASKRAFAQQVERVESSISRITSTASQWLGGSLQLPALESVVAGARYRRYLEQLACRVDSAPAISTLQHALELAHIALSLHDRIPAAPRAVKDAEPLGALLLGDYLVLSAVTLLAELGGESVATLGDWLIRYLRSEPSAIGKDGALAAALSRYLTLHVALAPEEIDALANGRQQLGAVLCAVDDCRALSRRRRRRVAQQALTETRAELARLPERTQSLLAADLRLAQQLAMED
jgi:hypothetical protein